MNRDVAKIIARTAFRSSAEIGDLVPFLKQNCDPEEYKVFSKLIATVSAEIGLQLLTKIFQLYPEIEKEFDEQIRKYGRLI